ncbi:hypothetical protein BH23ACT11_BH23ACT11_12710 [soil metagenome]
MILLGTGDPLNEERAQTSLAVPLGGKTPGNDDVLLIDTSSGTVLLRQLADAGIPVNSIRHLFLTHRHFDHLGGLAPLLVSLAPFQEVSLTIHATPETLRAARALLDLTIPGVERWLGERLQWRALVPKKTVTVNGARLTPFEVDHDIECVGYRVERDGSTLVFSGDTRPCPNVAEYARGVDLLVHEVYASEDSEQQAHAFGHSTATEAERVAREAGAERLVLTHFRASRYANPLELAAEAKAAFGGPVEAAHDLEAFDF